MLCCIALRIIVLRSAALHLNLRFQPSGILRVVAQCYIVLRMVLNCVARRAVIRCAVLYCATHIVVMSCEGAQRLCDTETRAL